MRKASLLSIFAVLGLLFSALSAHADIIVTSRIVPGTPAVVDLLIIGGVIVGVIVLISWLVIRAIRRKKNVINK
ncbi:MAG: hypothetical protein WC705_01960 [Candidatus Paceibacterota bacterium]|jgi:hypothetical protein